MGYVPSSNLSALYTNTEPGTVANGPLFDPAFQDIVTTINSNYDFVLGLINTSTLANMSIYNVRTYGAKGDGVTDDAAAINAAVVACSNDGGGIVQFPEGRYRINSTIVKLAKVSLVGTGGMTSIITWGVNTAGTVIDTSNQSIIHTKIEGLQLTKEAYVTADVVGIRGGSTLANYNQMQCAFRDLRINKMSVGIDGSADATGVGIFDCVIDNCWIEYCDVGLNSCGSQISLYSTKFHANAKAVVFERLNSNTVGSYNQFGGIFINNGWDYYVKSDSVRPSSIFGTWHEGSTNGILTIENTNTKLFTMKFENCMLSTKAVHPAPMMDFSKANFQSSIVVDNCTIYPTANGDAYTITRPTAYAADFVIKDSIQQNYDASIVKRNQSPAIYNDRVKIATGQRAVTSIPAGWSTHNVSTYGAVPYTASPLVYVTVQGAQRVTANAANVTATGFDINVYNWEAGAVSVNINWISIGA